MHTGCLLPVSPSMHCSGGCTWSWVVYLIPGGVPGPWGVYLPGGVPCPWGCTWSGGVPAQQGVCTCLGGVPTQGVPAQVLPPWTEWQIGAKILPCPKLRLRAVKNIYVMVCNEKPTAVKGREIVMCHWQQTCLRRCDTQSSFKFWAESINESGYQYFSGKLLNEYSNYTVLFQLSFELQIWKGV